MQSTDQARVLVVDDEPSIVDAIATALRYENFEVTSASTGSQAIAVARTFQPHLVVLDVMLPEIDGVEVCRRLSAEGMSAAVLFLSARGEIDARLAGLKAGGDDYVTKPFFLSEIIARAHTILRRAGGPDPAQQGLRCGDIELDESTHRVRRAGQSIRLTATEFRLLHYFMINANQVLSKAQILNNVWHYDFDGDGNVVETYVRYLRKKLDAHGPPLIETVRLVGYVLRSEPSQ
jgi:two-component system, OmpR family, response regulator